MRPKELFIGVAIMMLGLYLQQLLPLSQGWAAVVCFIAVVVIIVACRDWLFGDQSPISLGLPVPALPQAQTADGLVLLSVNLTSEYQEREDLGHPIDVRAVFRNDSIKPVSIQLLRWMPKQNAFPTNPIDAPLQSWSVDENLWLPRWHGTRELIVPRNGVFRVGIRARSTNADQLNKFLAAKALGTVTLTLENAERSFNI